MILSTSKRRLKPIDSNCTALGCNRLEESSPRKVDTVMVEPRTYSKLEALAKPGLESKSFTHSYSS